MQRRFWYVWWGSLAVVVVFNQVLNLAGDGEFSWYRWLLSVVLLITWAAVTFFVGIQEKDARRHFSFWWAFSIPALGFVPIAVLTALAQTETIDSLTPYFFWVVVFVVLSIPGGIAVVVLWFIRRHQSASLEKTPNVSHERTTPVPANRTCPFCAEEIKREAIKCKHCGSMIDDSPQVDSEMQSNQDT